MPNSDAAQNTNSRAGRPTKYAEVIVQAAGRRRPAHGTGPTRNH